MEDAYAIFGLNKDSTISDAKKAYYNLALMVHPDRTSCINKDVACNEMKSLTDLYNKIKKDIELRNKNEKYVNSLDLKDVHKKELDVLDEINKEMPSFMDIYFETHENMEKFNSTFENQKSFDKENDYLLNSNPGYITLKSEYKNNNNFEYNSNYNDIVELPILERKTNEITSIEDLATQTISNSLNCFDYSEAHGTPSLLIDRIPEENLKDYLCQKNIMEEFEKMRKDRNII